MRFGCCLNMVSGRKDGTGIEHIEELARAGYDYVELPTAQMMCLDDASFQTLAKRVKATGLIVEAENNLFPVTMRLTGEEADHEAALRYVTKAFSRAQSLGTRICVFGSGPAKNVPEGFPPEKGYDQVVMLLKRISGPAQDCGITIAIEPLRKAECNIINSFADGLRLAQDVNRENVKLLVDYYHFFEVQDAVSLIVQNGAEWIRHIHFANPEGRVFPKDPAESDYRSFAEALQTAGYHDRVSLEAYCKGDFEEEAKKSLSFFRELF